MDLQEYFPHRNAFGPRFSSSYSLLQSVGFVISVSLVLFAPWLIVLILCIAVWLRGGLQLSGRINDLVRLLKPILPLLIFIFFHIALLLFWSVTIAQNPVNNRYMSAVYVPIVLTLLFLLSHFAKRVKQRHSKENYRRFRFAVFAIVFIYPFILTTLLVASTTVVGAGVYQAVDFTDSEVVTFLEGVPGIAKQTIYTNDRNIAYMMLGLSVNRVPSREFEGAWPAADGYLIWYEGADSKHLLSIEAMSDFADLQDVARFSDATIYYVSTRGSE